MPETLRWTVGRAFVVMGVPSRPYREPAPAPDASPSRSSPAALDHAPYRRTPRYRTARPFGQLVRRSEPFAAAAPLLQDEQEIASIGGKYRGLVTIVRGRPPEPHATDEGDDEDEERPEPVDLGYRRAGTWQGNRSVPAGFWVYVEPDLYVWRELTPR